MLSIARVKRKITFITSHIPIGSNGTPNRCMVVKNAIEMEVPATMQETIAARIRSFTGICLALFNFYKYHETPHSSLVISLS
jgi:hypothetical protein